MGTLKKVLLIFLFFILFIFLNFFKNFLKTFFEYLTIFYTQCLRIRMSYTICRKCYVYGCFPIGYFCHEHIRIRSFFHTVYVRMVVG